jgi:hypothetical protein
MHASATVLNVQEVAASPPEFYKAVTDHMPIMAVLKSAADED